MGKFPIADKAVLKMRICLKCKARNPPGATSCRKCNYGYLRPKKARKKETK
ncbi:50S ribosomal protein L40e [Candidatus Micrarchaeota archaeon]|nr:50S ribosomal protein L40e [Candidatus Micrarchaeota archaeon]MBI5177442.1 50S ribosomal protein L40e [Candidatus Micrarchaeota archaeon]